MLQDTQDNMLGEPQKNERYRVILHCLILIAALQNIVISTAEEGTSGRMLRHALLNQIVAEYARAQTATKQESKESALHSDGDRKLRYARAEEHQDMAYEEDGEHLIERERKERYESHIGAQSNLPATLGSLACIHQEQIRRTALYDAYVHKELIATTPLASDVCRLITAYSSPQLAFARTFHLHEGPVFDIRMTNATQVISCDNHLEQNNGLRWDVHEGTILSHNIAAQHFTRSVPRQNLMFNVRRIRLDFAISPDGTRAADIEVNGTVNMWNNRIPFLRAIKNKKVRRLKHKDPANGFIAIRFSPCSSFVVLGALGGSVNILDAHTGHELYSFKHEASVTSLAFAPDGTTILAGLSNGHVCIWEGESLNVLHDVIKKRIYSDGPQPAVMADDQQSSIQLLGPDPDYTDEVFANQLCPQDQQECGNHCAECMQLCFTCGYRPQGVKCGPLCLQCGGTCISCLTSCPACCWWQCKKECDECDCDC